VNPRSVLHHGLVGLSLATVLSFATQAQTSRPKPPPRLPPNASQSSQIPEGVDTGTPMTSDSLPLGTPVPPNGTTNRGDQAARSAAARAAARPDPLTRTGAPLKVPPPTADAAVIREASRPASSPAQHGSISTASCAADADPAFRKAMSQCTGLADRSARSSCAADLMARHGCG
jgi:hypothetical protein